MFKTILLLVGLFILGGIFLFFWQWGSGDISEPQSPEINLSLPASPELQRGEPIGNALNRVTKKPFGIYITPKNSPIVPEKFTGWHTGADFEIFPGEENKDIEIFAICSGKLLVKEFGRGYGGMLVQACDIDNQPVTVVYGHLKLASVKQMVGDNINIGNVLGILGEGFTSETDFERKHLHLGIHKGSAIDTRGYVASESELINWIDPISVLKK